MNVECDVILDLFRSYYIISCYLPHLCIILGTLEIDIMTCPAGVVKNIIHHKKSNYVLCSQYYGIKIKVFKA